jgi:YesN/AraC family two-component response regulator
MSDLIALKEIAKDLSALVVEDSITIQKQMQKFLEKLFGKVYVAKDGYEALEIYKEFKPNIILTDIQMPKMDGYELIQNLNTLNHTSKIIVFSAYGQAENVIKFLRMGVCDFIQKPVNFNQLTASLLKVTSGNICDEEKFEDELLNDLKIIKDSKLPIKLINHYKGLPLIHEGIIVSLKEDSLQIHTQKNPKESYFRRKEYYIRDR